MKTSAQRICVSLRFLIGLCPLLASLWQPPGVSAQDLEPRAYTNIPVGLNFLLVGFAHSEGGIPLDPSSLLEDAKVESRTGVLAYSRSLGLGGRSGSVNLIIPYSRLSGSALVDGDRRSRTVRGLGDPALRFTYNFFGAPALDLKDFRSYRQRTIFGTSLLVKIPIGRYEPSKLLNIGTNRWTVKPELGVSRVIGRWIVEAAAAAAFFTDNDDFFGGNEKKQDPIYSLQGHVILPFRPGLWGALDATYYAGGRTTVNGEEKDNLQQNWRLGATLAVPVDRRNSIKLYASTGVHTRTKSNFDLFGLAWQYRWGGGL